MLVIPAIDLKDGKCVRLIQGKADKITVYSEDPILTAKKWVQYGAGLLHIIDLDGAFTGSQKNFHIIKSIKKAIDIPIQVGGGIRDIPSIVKLTSVGVDKVIIGTIAVRQPYLFKKACDQFQSKVVAAIDAKDGKIAIKGWVEKTQVSVFDFAKEVEAAGAESVIYTDISRDGMLKGPNLAPITKMVDALNIPVIASGGVSSLEDIRSLLTIRQLHGVITGKAIYTGALNLKEAINQSLEAS